MDNWQVKSLKWVTASIQSQCDQHKYYTCSFQYAIDNGNIVDFVCECDSYQNQNKCNCKYKGCLCQKACKHIICSMMERLPNQDCV